MQTTENKRPAYSRGEEIANAITHGIGAVISIVALISLLLKAVKLKPQQFLTKHLVAYSIFGASLILLYLISTLYHSLPFGAKKVFGILDHCSIYILIAGTYTPFCLTLLQPISGRFLFFVIWGLAVLGVITYTVFGKKIKAISVILYLIMGWLIVFVIKELKTTSPKNVIVFLLAGGVFYTIGCIFYALKKIKWTHTIWHIFVLAGSIFHFFSVYYSF